VKLKTTLILVAVFAALLALVLYFDSKGEKTKAVEEKTNTLIDLAAADVLKVALTRGLETIVLERDGAGPWRLTSPLEAPADDAEVTSLVGSLTSLRIERVVEKVAGDLAAYELPKTEVSLWVKGKDEPVRLLVGMENPLDKTLFAKRADDPRLVLLASTLKPSLEKTVFDFRLKDVFKFAAEEVKGIRVRAKDVAWTARREETGWKLKSPVAALAAKGRLDSLLEALAGLKAKSFVTEEKTASALEMYGLAKPDYEVALSLPGADREIVFALGKRGEAQYATTSLSTKVVSFEGPLLADLDRKVDEIREKKVADLYAWDAKSVLVRRDGLEIVAVKEKVGEEEKWLLDPVTKAEADRNKVEDFVRRIEGLEAAAFVDSPGPLAGFGLDPGTEIRIVTRDYQDKEKEIVLFVGREDAASKQVAVKAADLEYLFLVDAAFLADLPKDKAAWQAEAPKTAEGQTDKK
jgi:hypothetical protein